MRYREKKQMFRLVSLDMMRHITIGTPTLLLIPPPLHSKENKMRKLKYIVVLLPSRRERESLSPCVWRRTLPFYLNWLAVS